MQNEERSLICRYLAGSNVFNDFSCQKKLVCELYWESEDLGELGVRGAHGLDLALDGSGEVSKYVTLPRPVTNAIEEFKVRIPVPFICCVCENICGICNRQLFIDLPPATVARGNLEALVQTNPSHYQSFILFLGGELTSG